MNVIKYINGTQEVSRINCPITYSGKEDWYTRLIDNPRLAKPVEITLPRASFSITSYTYAKDRKLSSYNTTVGSVVNGSAATQYQSVPWDLGFELLIYVRNVEDGTQLIEQILPLFTPSYSLSINYIPELNITRSAPLTLNGVRNEVDYEGDAQEMERTIIWTLDFTLQAQFFGPINTGNVITQVNTGIYIDTTLGSDGLASDVELVLANTGYGNYQINEPVYQGMNLPDATATGIVSTFYTFNNTLVLANVNGTFVTGSNVTGAITGATYTIAQTSPDILMTTITVTPAPPGANAETAFGFDTQIIEEIGQNNNEP